MTDVPFARLTNIEHFNGMIEFFDLFRVDGMNGFEGLMP